MLLHNLCTFEFGKQYRKNIIGLEHKSGGELKLSKLYFPNGSSDEDANFWGLKFEKDGEKFLVPSHDTNGNHVDIIKALPIKPLQKEKVANRDNVFWLVDGWKSMQYKPEMIYNMSEIVEKLTAFEHTNKIHQTINIFIGLVSYIDRAYFGVATPPSFGKDSSVFPYRDMFGDVTSIVSPTVAKLQFLAPFKRVVVNEAVLPSKAQWRDLEQYLLDVTDFKTEVPKHSRATSGVGEFIDISHHSISLFYNDVDCYPEVDKYFDFVAKKALLNRLPRLRLYGNLIEKFNKMRTSMVNDFVTKNFDEYRNLVYSITYYKQNLTKELHGYKTDKFDSFPERWKLNFDKLCMIIDVASKDEKTFNFWVDEILKGIKDYSMMIKYAEKLPAVMSTIRKEAEDLFENVKLMENCPSIDAIEEKMIKQFKDKVDKYDTFTDKYIELLEFRVDSKSIRKDIEAESTSQEKLEGGFWK